MRAALPVAACFAVAACAVAMACSEGIEGGKPSGFADASDTASGAIDGGPNIDADLSTGQDADLFEGGCAKGTAKAVHDPIYMLMVLDGSGSMKDDHKWEAVVPALDFFIDDLLAEGDTSFGLGLTIFSDTNDTTVGKGPYGSIDVPIAFVDATQAAKLHARLDNAQPRWDTPMEAVMSGQYPLVEGFAPSAPLLPKGKKVLAFMTDGVPYPDPDAGAKAAVIARVGGEFAKVAPDGPVTTVAVGIGYFFPYSPSTYDTVFMGHMAIAGGAPNDPCNAEIPTVPSSFCHFQVTPAGSAIQLENEFRIVIDRLRSRVASCEFMLDKVDGGLPIEPDRANVVFTDDHGSKSIVPEDPQDGWTYDDNVSPTKIILHGNACTSLRANVRGKVEVVLGCKTIVR